MRERTIFSMDGETIEQFILRYTDHPAVYYLFSFLLGYNDFLVTSLLLDAQNQTMVPAIAGYFNRETTTTDQVEAVAAAVSITAPLFLLVMVFQRQIVSGLTAGAVKG